MKFSTGGPPRPLIPAGMHIARLYSIAELGTHDDTFEGKIRPRTVVCLTWELPGQMHDFGKGALEPMAISRKFTASMHVKAGLRKFIEGWGGKAMTDAQAVEYDISKALGKTCLLNIVHGKKQDGEPRADIAAASGLMEGQKCPPPINKPIFYELKYGIDPKGVFGRLPEWQQKMVASCKEITNPASAGVQPDAASAPQPDAPDEDDVPF